MSDFTARERLERTIAIVPWVASQPGGWATWTEIGERFDLTVEQAESCLTVASLVGVAPYTPDALIEVLIESDGVSVRLPEFFRRPLRPTPEQTFALLTTAKALTALEGGARNSALHNAIEKVLAALGDDAPVIEVELDEAPDETIGVLRAAIAASRVVTIDYFVYGRDEVTVRRIDPWRVQQAGGHWYLQGRCHERDDTRLFRLDRMLSVSATEDTFVPPPEIPPFVVFDADAGAATVRLHLAPSAAWVLEYYPAVTSERRPDGSAEVELVVGSRAWLERLLLRLGSDAALLDCPPEYEGCAASAARRLLGNYRK